MAGLRVSLSLLLLASCTHGPTVTQIKECITAQTEAYGDICRESQGNFEGMDAFEAHAEGVECGAVSVGYCLGLE